MSPQNDGSLRLDEVKERFVQAEEKIRTLSAAAEALSNESRLLEGARKSIAEAASGISSVTTSLTETSTEIRRATEAIQKTEPAKILQLIVALEARLTSLGEKAEDISSDTDSIKASLKSLGEKAEDVSANTGGIKASLETLQQQTETAFSRASAESTKIKQLVVWALVLAGLAAILGGVGLILP